MGNILQSQPKETVCTQTANNAHNVFTFDEITFDSRFDSGNLMLAHQSSPGKYDLWIAPDCYKTPYEVNNCVWFYFKVYKIDLQGANEHTISFTIKNMKKVEYNNYAKQGMVPVYRSPVNNYEWRYLPTPLDECKVVGGSDLEIKFSYTFTEPEIQDGVSFAFTFPYTFSDCLKYVSNLEKVYANHQHIYFHRELLTRSTEGRPIDLLTITAHDIYSSDPRGNAGLEPLLPGLFPDHTQQQKGDTLDIQNLKYHQRSIAFKKKKYVLLSARVHPGEPPANYMLQGLLDSLLNENDPASKLLLESFVFVVVPMLNPDGVYKGYARTDAKGVNLQCVYHQANSKPREYPGPHGVVELAKHFAKDGRLVLYLDLHAHSNKDAAFIYGTYHSDFEARADMRLFARLLDIYSRNFNYNSCEFGSIKLSMDPSKAGIAKTEIRKKTNLVHAYTLETSFHVTTKDPQRYSLEENPQKDLSRKVVKKIGVRDFMEVGEGIKNAILDMFYKDNLCSALAGTFYGNIQELRKDVCEKMMQARKVRQQAKTKAKLEAENIRPNEIKDETEGGKQGQKMTEANCPDVVIK